MHDHGDLTDRAPDRSTIQIQNRRGIQDMAAPGQLPQLADRIVQVGRFGKDLTIQRGDLVTPQHIPGALARDLGGLGIGQRSGNFVRFIASSNHGFANRLFVHRRRHHIMAQACLAQ